ncbi:phage tail protein [Brenneria populi]|uniref:Phage tail protein n=1 Tax=Brenneria populi TaxID=1505588 RepID=A0ABU6JNJ8_9GAMM|nr:phage tail protein [Brenneria populi Li et al. 2015]
MAQSAVTRAFEAWNVSKILDGLPAVPDKVVFALIPNQDENKPVNRDERMPAAATIKHTANITQSGVLNDNAVVYSVVLDTTVGDWEYNWIGLVDSKTNTVLMIVHVRTQQKLKTQNGQQGNSLTRNLSMQFDGAAEATQINVSAQTWQVDFSARLFSMDEAHRLAMQDYYGVAAFLNDGFKVSLAGTQATIAPGVGYVGGLRVQQDVAAKLAVTANTAVWLDVSRQGTATGAWQNRITFKAAADLKNYTDAAGYDHYVAKIATLVNGQLADNRKVSPIAALDEVFLKKAGDTMTGELLFSSADAMRLINGDYGVILRSDGRDFYLLLTNKGDKTGSWNALRPFKINLATGEVTMGHNVDADTLLEKGKRVYSPNNKPTAADVGALTDVDATKKFASLVSPALTGKPTAPTADQASNDTQLANTAFVKAAITALVNGSPGALDTLQELAKALGNDPNFSTTILNEIAKKLPLSGGALSGQLTINNILKVTASGPALPDSQGAHICWNRVNGAGRTDFVNHRGSGVGGFTFWNGNNESLKELASLNGDGALLVVGAISEGGKRVYSPNNKPTAADTGALPANGGTLTGNVTIANDSAIQWERNSDYARIGFKNDADGDTNSYLYFRTGDNGNEYFRWEHSASTSSAAEWMSLKADGLRIKGNLAYHAGNKPTAADVGAISVSELAGIPLPWPLATAPNGWLKCNGQAFDKTTYPKLAAAYPTGKLPDLRGEFIRGWDDGRGVDAGRALLSAQSDAMQPITAGWVIDDQATDANYPPSGALYFDGLGTVNYDSVSDRSGKGAKAHFDSSRVTRTASETRPRNMAFNYIVRAA